VQAINGKVIGSGHLTILYDTNIQLSPLKIPELTGTRLTGYRNLSLNFYCQIFIMILIKSNHQRWLCYSWKE